MFRFVTSLFRCPHKHCSFPITTRGRGPTRSDESSIATYVVCLDCGREFPYDWKTMKILKSGKHGRGAVA